MTEYDVGNIGEHPRGWPPGSTWDEVPGGGSARELIIGTMDDGRGGRKVPGPGEGPVTHGAFNLIGHEGGHSFDGIATPARNTTPAFRSARQDDVNNGKIINDYFLQPGNSGFEETFAECCARHFGNDPTFASTWSALQRFWAGDPFGVT